MPLTHRSRGLRATIQVLFALLVPLVAGGVLDLGWSLAYWNRIYPGVRVAAVAVGGLPPDEAAQRLRTAFPYPTAATLTLVYEDHTWTARPAELGFVVDALGTAQDAWAVGRTGPWWKRRAARWQAWWQGAEVPLRTVFSEPWALAYLQTQVAPLVERPGREAAVWLEGTQVRTRRGQPGLRLDVDTTLARLRAHLQAFSSGPVEVAVQTVPPTIADPEPVARRARAALAGPLTLSLPADDPQPAGPWVFPPEQVAPTLRVVRTTDAQGRPTLDLTVDRDAWRPTLERIAADLAQTPVNARFTFDDATGQLVLLEPAVWGRRVDVEASLDALTQALAQGRRQVPLQVHYTPPPDR